MVLRLNHNNIKGIFFTTILCAGCTFSQTDPITGELSNKGVVAVNQDKIYLASTKFISRESDSDENVKNLVKDNGFPSALSVSSTLLTDTSARLYYSKSGTYFDIAKSTAGWIITGPFKLTDSEITELSKLAVSIETPKEQEEEVETKTPELVEKPQPTPNAEKKGFASPTTASKSDSLEAETTPKGDIVHYVTFPGESLSIIARWYTNERENAGKIGRLNKLKDANQLEIGDVLVIPSYLIKNKKRFTETALKELQNTASKESK